jgi:hypothetical protein
MAKNAPAAMQNLLALLLQQSYNAGMLARRRSFIGLHAL